MLNLRIIEEQGWVEFEGVSSTDDLVSIANQIGNVKPHPNGEVVFSLVPSNGERCNKGTFSNIYGYSEFPLHTDTAFWSTPARYLVLGMIDKSSCNTHIISFSDVLAEMEEQILKCAKNSIYIINTFEGKKFTSAYFKNGSQAGFRFDPNCMTPVNRYAKLFHVEFLACLKKINPKPIAWTGNKAVVLDNWRTLHGRESVSHLDRNRKLMRVYTG